MLYVTTRSDADVYTAQRILWEKRGRDGGLFVPFRNPRFFPEEIDTFSQKSFNACVAELLNLQFNTRLTSWDVDLAVGRYPVRLKKLSQRILVAECWHNTRDELNRMVEKLGKLLLQDEAKPAQGDWIRIAVRIAVLFGIYGELKRAGIADRDNPFDVSAVAGDFITPISAWYARAWGLPIANIVCCCNENGGLWNLFSHGQLRTDTVAVNTRTPAADIVVPESLERLICAVAGSVEAERYGNCAQRGATYYLPTHFQSVIRRGMYISVVSQSRMLSTISNVFTSGGYLMSAYDALCHAGVLDYRARTGSGRCALLFSELAPVRDVDTLADALERPAEEIRSLIDQM